MGMGVAGGGGGGGRRRRGGSRNKMMSEINVTPFVDVVLVLLIVFMVAAPMMTAGVAIDLPQSSAGELETPRTPITVSVNPAGEIYLGEDLITAGELVAAVGAQAESTEDRIYVRGDTAANYGTVMQVMGTLSSAGYSRIGLITQQPTAEAAGQ
ncbi:biopolymer transporter ExbD [Pelagibacterium luteolum]|uniref:Cell division and transport-associated protein TolR (TC 2.C.1.2.1) n=1 Tax=Pelagibacterium luteolum TaxID=440168 RepID=A0A1G7ZEH6_9HYPH|nr:biopolymer transporter ExbD [Pelagibacterium luteolum]SDH06510.1 Cell division and transport-associated protein TolR (TC 2.C.1.2.1) [Pelagibacterium luteolum]